MALGKSLKFVKQFMVDKNFRDKCNTASTKDELLEMLDFSASEFEDAISMSLFKCQSQDEAERIEQVKMWFYLL